MDPRSKTARTEARLKVWRILTILSAMEVIGERRSVVRDRVTGKKVHVENADPLLSVKAFRTVGSQVPFEPARRRSRSRSTQGQGNHPVGAAEKQCAAAVKLPHHSISEQFRQAETARRPSCVTARAQTEPSWPSSVRRSPVPGG
jgi:hypothetical protein